MGLPYIGNIAIIWLAHLDEFGYVVGMVCPHLHYRHLRVRRDGKQGKRYAYVVIEIAFCGCDLEFCPQCRSNQFFCSSLPISACQTYDRQSKGLAVMYRQFLKAPERILDRNYLPFAFRGGPGISIDDGV